MPGATGSRCSRAGRQTPSNPVKLPPETGTRLLRPTRQARTQRSSRCSNEVAHDALTSAGAASLCVSARRSLGSNTVTRNKPVGGPAATTVEPQRRTAPPQRRPPMTRLGGADDGATQQPPTALPSRMIFKPEVMRRCGVSYPTIWKWMVAGTFPRSFDVGGKTGWLESEIERWIVNRPRSRLKGDRAGGGS